MERFCLMQYEKVVRGFEGNGLVEEPVSCEAVEAEFGSFDWWIYDLESFKSYLPELEGACWFDFSGAPLGEVVAWVRDQVTAFRRLSSDERWGFPLSGVTVRLPITLEKSLGNLGIAVIGPCEGQVPRSPCGSGYCVCSSTRIYRSESFGTIGGVEAVAVSVCFG